MRIFCIGDVVGKPGLEHLRRRLPAFRRERGIDVVIANGENAATGNGISPNAAEFLLDSGVDVITTGNHAFHRKEAAEYFDTHPQVLRPANYPPGCPGQGCYLYDGGSFTLLVISLLGVAFLEPLDNPFYTVDALMRQNPATFTVVDFHAEATGEKKAMGYYLDGRASLVVGTHTHIQTADAQLLPGSTGYITDLGMTGPIHSVLGVEPSLSIARFKNRLPVRFETAEGPCRMDGIVADLDRKTGLCTAIEAVVV